MTSKPYISKPIPIQALDWEQLIPRIGMAQAAVARFDGILQAMINPELLLSPLTTQEAVLSSRIEGTQASLEDVLRYDVAPRKDAEHKDDIAEVKNYQKAMEESVVFLKKGRFARKELLSVHKILTRGVRGEGKQPGKIRNVQNYIGYRGDTMEKAIFIPPIPEHLPSALDDFFAFFQSTQQDTLVQTALLHAQFELIHPFLDGNGRMGRILIPLHMFSKGLIAHPTFYISEHFEARRPEYYRRLSDISRSGNWQDWVVFFLDAVVEQAELNTSRALAILQLYNRMKEEINRLTRSQHALETLDALFRHAFITGADFIRQTGLNRRTAYRILDDLQQAGILVVHEPARGSRPAILCFDQLVSITQKRSF